MAQKSEKTEEFKRNDKKIHPPFQEEEITPPGLEEKMHLSPKLIHPDYKGSSKLEGKLVLITGGDSGIGRSICLHVAKEGGNVAFTYLSQEELDANETLKMIQAQGVEGFMICTDLTKEGAEDEIVKSCLKNYKNIDVLINNAAYQNHVDSFENLSIDQLRHTFEVNFFSGFKLIKAALPYMKKNSNIINTGSVLGYVGDDSLVDYSCAKGAIHTMTKSLAKAFASKKIRVNSVAPGPVWTPLNPAERKQNEMKKFGASTSFNRPAQPAEIAPAYIYLASDITGSFITGETVNLFGAASVAN